MSATLETLFATIEDRKANPSAESYTAKLFAAGEGKICQKIGEEAVEVVVAALADEGDDRVLYEMGDMFYHSLVLLSARGLTFADLEAELAKRFK
ncbi:MAG: phosphoribosyl-ATP diphosphatase [Caldilineaceae bacterium]